jgi:uncharacterized membrane protein
MQLVRIHFQETPWDLLVALGYTLLLTGAMFALGVGNPAAVLLILFFPGFVSVAALFPGSKEISWAERVALSLGLSMAVGALLGLGLNLTPFGIRFAPITATVALFTILTGLVAYWRRMRLPVEKRLSATLDLTMPEWEKYSGIEKTLTIALAASIFVAGGALTYIVMTPPPGERFAEFYLYGPGVNGSLATRTLNISQEATVSLGIVNHESAIVNYTVRVDLVGVQIVYNAAAQANETVELNRTTWSWLNVTLADGQNWTRPYTFSIPTIGLWKVQFLLYKDGAFSSAYRELHLYVTVT